MVIPYCYEACTACRMCTQLSSFAESEINGLVPQALSSFPSFAVHTVSDLKLGGYLGTRLLIQYLGTRLLIQYLGTRLLIQYSMSCKLKACLPVIMSSRLRANFILRGHLPCICNCYVL